MLDHESYFSRHTAQLDLLRDDILPRLDAQRREAGRPMLVVWIAGCSTGEEAWTLAFLAPARGAGVFGEAVPVPILPTAPDRPPPPPPSPTPTSPPPRLT